MTYYTKVVKGMGFLSFSKYMKKCFPMWTNAKMWTVILGLEILLAIFVNVQINKNRWQLTTLAYLKIVHQRMFVYIVLSF